MALLVTLARLARLSFATNALTRGLGVISIRAKDISRAGSVAELASLAPTSTVRRPAITSKT